MSGVTGADAEVTSLGDVFDAFSCNGDASHTFSAADTKVERMSITSGEATHLGIH